MRIESELRNNNSSDSNNTAAGLKSVQLCGRLTVRERLFLALSALFVMLFATCSSPLYAFNYWDDANVFFTMGRGILRGMVPYRDLYEQKGPVLYFAHALCALISSKSFIGVWLMEVALATVFAFFSWKIVKLYYVPSKLTIAIVPAYLALVYTIRMINYGDCAEELCFPLLTIVVFLVLRAANGTKPGSDRLPCSRDALIIGIITGLLFWIKYTFLGAIIGVCIYMILWTIRPKAWKKLLKLVAVFLAGVAAVSIPVLLYFAANHALRDLFEAYFYNNIVYYEKYDYYKLYGTHIYDMPVIGHFSSVIFDLLGSCMVFPKYAITMILIAVGGFTVRSKSRDNIISLFFLSLVFCLAGIFTKPHIIYYYGYITMFLAPFALLLMVRIAGFLFKVFVNNKMIINTLYTALAAVLLFVAMVTCKNLYMLKYDKEDYPQYRFAEIINRTPDAKILTYDVMDSGYYLASGTMPSTPYFCYLNIENTWPVILNEQNRLIAEGAFDYIITYDSTEDDANVHDWPGYKVVDTYDFTFCDYTGKKLIEGVRLYEHVS